MSVTCGNSSKATNSVSPLGIDMIKAYKEICNNQLNDKDKKIALYVKKIGKEININDNMNKLKSFDKSTYEHSVRVSILCALIGKIMKCDTKKIAEICVAGLLHDVGKIKVGANIIKKPGALTDDERNIMEQHPNFSIQFIANINSLSPNIISGVFEHHEKMDGSGYPRGLKGSNISMVGRVMAVADIFDAYSSKRCYHEKRTIAETLEYMKRISIDQKILDLLIQHLDRNTGKIMI